MVDRFPCRRADNRPAVLGIQRGGHFQPRAPLLGRLVSIEYGSGRGCAGSLAGIRPLAREPAQRQRCRVQGIEVPGVDATTSRQAQVRSEERRVGKECVSKCRSRWSPYHKKKKSNK